MVVVVARGRFHRESAVQLAEAVPVWAGGTGLTVVSSAGSSETDSWPAARHDPGGNVPAGNGPAGPTAPAQEGTGVPPRLWREVVGEQIRQLRTDRTERLADVAERAGVSPQYLSEVERGVKDPSSEVLAAVAGALGTSVEGLARRAYRLPPVPQPSTGPNLGMRFRQSRPVCLAA
ncbi:helix-turn-helix transcriptional regulator (plasmid) [Rhodococcus sp. PSBB049]|nr:helix-turn-helix transcriptional regulator [Rhodococcus sp. PSBB049]